MRRSSQKGLTLIELIVVVTILVALAAIAVPQFVNYKNRAERATIIADCNAIFRGFTVYYLENNEYPWKDTVGPQQFNLTTFAPLTNLSLMGMNIGLEVNIQHLKTRLKDGKGEAFDSPDDSLGTNQEFYLVLPWAADPEVKFVVAQADDVKEADGTLIDGGNWLDGVFVEKDGSILYK